MRLESPSRGPTPWKASKIGQSRQLNQVRRGPWSMQVIQLAVSNTSQANAIQNALEHNGDWDIARVAQPDPRIGGIILVDDIALDRVLPTLVNPERVVLITRNRPESLTRAWDSGIISVVFESDSIETILLAVLAASLRSTPSRPALPIAK